MPCMQGDVAQQKTCFRHAVENRFFALSCILHAW